MSFETLVSVLLVFAGALLGLMQWFRTSTEKWCKELFVLNSDFATLQQKVLGIETSVNEIKLRTNQIYEKLLEKS